MTLRLHHTSYIRAQTSTLPHRSREAREADVSCTSAAPQSRHCLATLLRFSTSRPFRARTAPSLANRTLVPAPIPELAPVISVTFPLREDTCTTGKVLTCKNKLRFNLHTTKSINKRIWRTYFERITCGHDLPEVQRGTNCPLLMAQYDVILALTDL